MVEHYCSLDRFFAIFFNKLGIYVKIVIYFVHEGKFPLFVVVLSFMRGGFMLGIKGKLVNC